MELIIIIVAITAIIVIYSMMNMKIKELKAIALNQELNEIAKKLPTNKEPPPKTPTKSCWRSSPGMSTTSWWGPRWWPRASISRT